jgi:aspartate ammonia-lyase
MSGEPLDAQVDVQRPVIDLTGDDPPMRLERDALGPLAIPAGASYGIHTARAVSALAISTTRLSDYPDLVSALGAVKQAAARANLDAGVLTSPMGKAVDQAAARLTNDAPEIRSSLVADPLAGGGSIGVHMNANEVIANFANLALGHPFGAYDPVHPKRHVAASQSTADVCHTASRLAVVAGIELLERVVADLVETLRERAHAFSGSTTLARTCLQDAMPAPADLLFAGAASALTRRLDALAHTASPLAGVVLGGTVIGTGDNAPERYRERVVPHLCEITGRNLFLHPDRPSALQHSDDLVAVSAEISALATVTTKLARDLRLLTSGPNGGFGEVVLPHVIEGSSFFGDKRNPAVAESMISAGIQITGHDASVRAAAAHAELHLNVFDHVAVVNTLDALSLLTEATERFNHGCVMGIELDQARLAELVGPADDAGAGADATEQADR